MLTPASPEGRLLAAALLLAALAGCDAGPGEERGVLVLEPGRRTATYPGPEAERRPSPGYLSAVAVAGGELYAADQQAGRVHRFSADGPYLNALGRKGEGPGELQHPTEVEVGPSGGVWVADPPGGRVSRFRPDGSLGGLRRAPYGGTDFGLLPRGRIVVPSPTPGHLLAVVAPGDEITELAPGPGAPTALAEMAPEERFGFMATFLESDPRDGSVYFLVNREDYSLWALQLDEESGTIGGSRRIEMPEWLTEAMRSRREEQREGLGEAGLQFVPFNDLHLTASGLWMTTGPIGALGVALPVEDGGRPVVVRPARGGETPDDRFRGLLHARLAPDGLYAVFATEVRAYALDTVGVRRRPGLR